MSRFQSRYLSLVFLIASLFGFVVSTPAIAVEVLQFGPQTVVRQQGSPQEELFNFNVPVPATGSSASTRSAAPISI